MFVTKNEKQTRNRSKSPEKKLKEAEEFKTPGENDSKFGSLRVQVKKNKVLLEKANNNSPPSNN